MEIKTESDSLPFRRVKCFMVEKHRMAKPNCKPANNLPILFF